MKACGANCRRPSVLLFGKLRVALSQPTRVGICSTGIVLAAPAVNACFVSSYVWCECDDIHGVKIVGVGPSSDDDGGRSPPEEAERQNEKRFLYSFLTVYETGGRAHSNKATADIMVSPTKNMPKRSLGSLFGDNPVGRALGRTGRAL